MWTDATVWISDDVFYLLKNCFCRLSNPKRRKQKTNKCKRRTGIYQILYSNVQFLFMLWQGWHKRAGVVLVMRTFHPHPFIHVGGWVCFAFMLFQQFFPQVFWTLIVRRLTIHPFTKPTLTEMALLSAAWNKILYPFFSYLYHFLIL